MRFTSSLASLALLSSLASVAHAQSSDAATDATSRRDPRRDVPLVNYTMSAFGADARTAGASAGAGALGRTVDASGLDADQDPNTTVTGKNTQLIGTARVWGSPIDHVTLFFLVDPREQLHGLAPSATALVRIAGDKRRGWAFAGSLTYKADGFDDLGGELEYAFLLSAIAGRFHVDSNLVCGHDFDSNEADCEFKARPGFDLGDLARVGFDGRLRGRLSGRSLPGNRLADVVAGPEIMIGKGRVYFDAFGGPSTVGVASGVGWTATGTIGVLVL